MSLSSLRRSAPSTKPRLVSVDEFIDDAVAYSAGHPAQDAERRVVPIFYSDNDITMRRATFSLNHETLATLQQLSDKTGIAKSRLIRIWASEQALRPTCCNLTFSKVK